MTHCDTSLLVSIVTTETHRDVARSRYSDSFGEICAISDRSRTEVADASTRKHRGRVIDDDHRHVAEAAGKVLEREMSMAPVTSTHFTRAALVADAVARGPRVGDAPPLAIVPDHRYDLATLDRDLVDAARAPGVAAHMA